MNLYKAFCKPDHEFQQTPKGGRKQHDRVLHYIPTSRCRKDYGSFVSYIKGDRFSLGPHIGSGNASDAFNHSFTFQTVEKECKDQTDKCVIFEGYRAFHDRRIMELLDIPIWMDVPYDVALQR